MREDASRARVRASREIGVHVATARQPSSHAVSCALPDVIGASGFARRDLDPFGAPRVGSA
jgi:hypothetical protein